MTGPPAWDAAFADRLEGATVLVGLTYDEPDGAKQEQFYGTVMAANAIDGISIRMEGHRAGEWFTLPPHLSNFTPASSGQYRLRETGEIVVDPEFTATWVITKPPN